MQNEPVTQQMSRMQKHLFYLTTLIILCGGSLSSVFRSDFEGKVVSVVCIAILTLICAWQYLERQQERR